MKFSLGGKQFIEFATDVEGLEQVAPVQKSTHFTPRWFKDMKDYIHRMEVFPVGMVNQKRQLRSGLVEL
jgi:hypothetical protein